MIIGTIEHLPQQLNDINRQLFYLGMISKKYVILLFYHLFITNF